MSRLPPLNTLRSFEVAGRHLNFSRAAEEFNVTQSAVSHQMKLLEERLGARLFKRANNGLILTDAGQRLLPAVRDSFARLEKVVAEIDAEARETPVRVALRPYFAVKWLAPRLGRFWQRHPAIELWLNHTIERVAFADDDVDLAIEWSTGERADVGADRLVGGGLTPVFSPALADGREALSAPPTWRATPCCTRRTTVTGEPGLASPGSRTSPRPMIWSSTTPTCACRRPSTARASRWVAAP